MRQLSGQMRHNSVGRPRGQEIAGGGGASQQELLQEHEQCGSSRCLSVSAQSRTEDPALYCGGGGLAAVPVRNQYQCL